MLLQHNLHHDNVTRDMVMVVNSVLSNSEAKYMIDSKIIFTVTWEKRLN